MFYQYNSHARRAQNCQITVRPFCYAIERDFEGYEYKTLTTLILPL